jgi:hypothetical protein
MQSRILVVLFGLLLAPALATAAPARAAAPHLVAVINLEPPMAGKTSATVDVGGGVALKIEAGRAVMMQNLTILADGHPLKKLEGGKFLECARIQEGPITYWSIAEYTGGAHCCGQFTFLARAAAGQPVRYLGQTTGYNGGPAAFPGSFLYRGGQLYFQAYDDRFDYFHTSHAGSMLVNVPPYFYRLTPTSLTVDNLPFKDVYLKGVAEVNREIRREAQRRRPARAILKPGFGSGFANTEFSDPMGQLLVKRTILYLYAREDRKAWDSLRQGVARYYRTSAGVPQLQREIAKTIHSQPY